MTILNQKENTGQWLPTNTGGYRWLDQDFTVILFKSKNGTWGNHIYGRGGAEYKCKTWLQKLDLAKIVALRHLEIVKTKIPPQF